MGEASKSGGLRFGELPVGHAFETVKFSIGAAELRAYLEATDAAQPGEARRVAPPLAVAAFALRRLAGALALQPGAVHGGQEYEFRRPVEVGETLTASSRVANRTRRQGTVILIIEQEVRSAAEIVMKGRSSLAVAAE